MATKTNTPAKATDESAKVVNLTSRNGHGIARSFFAIPAYKLAAMARVQTAVYGD